MAASNPADDARASSSESQENWSPNIGCASETLPDMAKSCNSWDIVESRFPNSEVPRWNEATPNIHRIEQSRFSEEPHHFDAQNTHTEPEAPENASSGTPPVPSVLSSSLPTHKASIDQLKGQRLVARNRLFLDNALLPIQRPPAFLDKTIEQISPGKNEEKTAGADEAYLENHPALHSNGKRHTTGNRAHEPSPKQEAKPMASSSNNGSACYSVTSTWPNLSSLSLTLGRPALPPCMDDGMPGETTFPKLPDGASQSHPWPLKSGSSGISPQTLLNAGVRPSSFTMPSSFNKRLSRASLSYADTSSMRALGTQAMKPAPLRMRRQWSRLVFENEEWDSRAPETDLRRKVGLRQIKLNNKLVMVEMREMISKMNDALCNLRTEILDKLDVVRKQQICQGLASTEDIRGIIMDRERAHADDDYCQNNAEERHEQTGEHYSTIESEGHDYELDGFHDSAGFHYAVRSGNNMRAEIGQRTFEAEFESCNSFDGNAEDVLEDDDEGDETEYDEYIESDSALHTSADQNPLATLPSASFCLAMAEGRYISPTYPVSRGNISSYGSLQEDGDVCSTSHNLAIENSQLSISTAGTASDEQLLFIPVGNASLQSPVRISDLESSSIVSSAHSSEGECEFEDEFDSESDSDSDFIKPKAPLSAPASRLRDRSRTVLSTTMRFFRKRNVFRKKLEIPKKAKDKEEEAASEYTAVASMGKTPLSPVIEEDNESAPLLSTPISATYYLSPALNHRSQHNFEGYDKTDKQDGVRRKWRRLRKKARRYLRRFVRYLSCHVVFGGDDDSLLNVGNWTSESSGCRMTSTDSDCKEGEKVTSVNDSGHPLKKRYWPWRGSDTCSPDEKTKHWSKECKPKKLAKANQADNQQQKIQHKETPLCPTPPVSIIVASPVSTPSSAGVLTTPTSKDQASQPRRFPTTLRTPKKGANSKVTANK